MKVEEYNSEEIQKQLKKFVVMLSLGISIVFEEKSIKTNMRSLLFTEIFKLLIKLVEKSHFYRKMAVDLLFSQINHLFQMGFTNFFNILVQSIWNESKEEQIRSLLFLLSKEEKVMQRLLSAILV